MTAHPTIPPSMKAVCFTEPGGPDVLHVESIAVPTPGRGEVLIRVMAAVVNRPDPIQRQGLYPPPPGANPRLGPEVAGGGVGRWAPL